MKSFRPSLIDQFARQATVSPTAIIPKSDIPMFRLPGPLAAKQRRWRESLPWRVSISFTEADRSLLQTAFGISTDPQQQQKEWDELLQLLTTGRIMLRVIKLHPKYKIPPGETRTERQARLDRWLPKPFKGDGASMILSWASPVRFASLFETRNIKLDHAEIKIKFVSFDEAISHLKCKRHAAVWTSNGHLVLISYRDR